MDPKRSYSLSPMQQGLFFHYLRDGQSSVDVVQLVCELPESVDADALRAAWESAAARHEGLRAWFEQRDGGAAQHFAASVAVDFAEETWADTNGRLQDWLRRDRDAGFDLATPPLWRVRLLRMGPEDTRCVWTLHHVMADGRSCAGVLEEVFAEYDRRDGVTNRYTVDLSEPVPSRRFLAWLDARDEGGDEAFWRGQLEGAEPTRIADAGVPEGTGRGERELRLEEDLTQALKDAAKRRGVTLNTLVQAAWTLVLARHAATTDVIFGVIRAGRSAALPSDARSVGVFINTVPMRVAVRPDEPVDAFLERVRSVHVGMRDYEQAPLARIQQWSGHATLFDSILIFDHATLDGALRALGGPWAKRRVLHLEHTGYPLTAYAYGEQRLLLRVAWARDAVSDATGERLLAHFRTALVAFVSDTLRTVSDIPVLDEAERARLAAAGAGPEVNLPSVCIHELFDEVAAARPDTVAVVAEGEERTYAELDARADALLARLLEEGVRRGDRVGICMPRTVDLPAALLAVLRAGAAWVPLDPAYPRERLAFMLGDAGLRAVLTGGAADVLPRGEAAFIRVEDVPDVESRPARPAVAPDDVAWVIYTSGSTGRPKGVMVEHRNAINFFLGMDRHITLKGDDVWLALTSLSFDISILELVWTLVRGVRTVLHGEAKAPARAPGFSLFYFASSDENTDDRYRLLLDGARWADTHGFEAVWTPERHFHAFGGLYPNPAVTGAAVAAVTERVAVRAGSVVLPLHDPVRVAEEWAVVDRISGGRVGISVASGWHPQDFVLAPDRFADRKEGVFAQLDEVRRLWRGESIRRTGPKGEVELRTMPRPVQAELPVWMTTSGTRSTFERAGAEGLNLLTHLLGQNLEDLAENVAAYRKARADAGHAGPGHVTLMVHTFVAQDDETARDAVRAPLIAYLASAVDLVKNFAQAWTAVSRRARAEGPVSLEDLSEEDRAAVLEFAFERYYESSGLLGSVEKCTDMTRRIAAAGVDEIACLIDFGVSTDATLAHLDLLDDVRRAAARPVHEEPASVADALRTHGVTHLQCTPSRARLVLAEAESDAALAGVRQMLVGGEALPGDLARELAARVGGTVLNMYGPTETTIWSCVQDVSGEESDGTVPIGRPIANTTCRVVTPDGGMAPEGVPGELWIGGAGVARGYLGREELTAERFVEADGRVYRTGDVVRWRGNVLEFLGRNDQQVKIRGHRVEIGEVEAALRQHPAVSAAAAKAVPDGMGGQRLVGYVVTTDPDGAGALRAWLAERLPEPLVPNLLIALDALPLTPNGKLDRRALPDAAPSAEGTPGPPSTAVEKAVAEVWQEVLGIETVGVNDNFFDLGGHSLLTIRVQAKLGERFAKKVAITDLFRFPTVRALAAHLEGAVAAEGAVTGSDRAERRRQARLRRASGR